MLYHTTSDISNLRSELDIPPGPLYTPVDVRYQKSTNEPKLSTSNSAQTVRHRILHALFEVFRPPIRIRPRYRQVPSACGDATQTASSAVPPARHQVHETHKRVACPKHAGTVLARIGRCCRPVGPPAMHYRALLSDSRYDFLGFASAYGSNINQSMQGSYTTHLHNTNTDLQHGRNQTDVAIFEPGNGYDENILRE